METTELEPSHDSFRKEKTLHQPNSGPGENGTVLNGHKKTTINGNLVGVIADTKERLNAASETTDKQENGNVNADQEPPRSELEQQLKELRVEIDDLKEARQYAQKLEKEKRDLNEAYERKTQQQKAKIDELKQKLEEKDREVDELTVAKEQLVTEHREASKKQIEQLQVELENSKRKSVELTLAMDALRQETDLLQEQLQASELHRLQEKIAKKKAWASLETLRAGSKRLVVKHNALDKTAREELLHLTERVKELEILLWDFYPLLPGVDDLTECQCHLPELTGDDVLLTSHMRECQSCQRVVTPYLFHIKTCHKINCERCAHVRRLYCGHVFTCEKEECDVTGCVETREAIQDSQLSRQDLQDDKQFMGAISAHLRKSTSPTECGGIFRAFQQAEYWAVAVGPVNLHRHQVNNRLLQMCCRILPFTVSLAEQAFIACLSHSEFWSSCGHRKRCLVCNICLSSLRSCGSCKLPNCEICTIAAMACARHSLNCRNERCRILFCRYYKHCVREEDTTYPSPTVLALLRESILMFNRAPIAASLL